MNLRQLVYSFTAIVIIEFLVFFSLPQHSWQLAFLDIGQGDATLIITPTNQKILIDGGPTTKITEELAQILPFWDRNIDLLIATHPDTDHIAGLITVMKRFHVKNILLNKYLSYTKLQKEFLTTIYTTGTKPIFANNSQIIQTSDEGTISIISADNQAPSSNNSSVVSLLSIAKHPELLVTGDLEAYGEQKILPRAPLHTRILHVGHHGSKSSSTMPFLEALDPVYSIVSVGFHNRYHHPHPSTLTKLHKIHTQILRTDLLGTIRFIRHNLNWTIHTEKGML